MTAFNSWEERLEKFRQLCERYAEAKTTLRNLENLKPAILASAAMLSNESTAAGRRLYAECSEEYDQWLKAHHKADGLATRLGLQVEAERLWFEMARTQEASRRDEMKFTR